MPDTLMPGLAALLAGAAIAGGAVWFWAHRQLRAAQRRGDDLAARLAQLGHDMRGAVTPAMLLAERLEGHADPAVQKSAAMIVNGLEHAASLAKTASSLAGSRSSKG